MSQVRRPLPLTLGFVVLATVVAFVLTMATPLKVDSPFLVFLGAVVFSSRYGGFASGLLSIALATILSLYFILPPYQVLAVSTPEDAFRLGTFIVIGLLVNWLTAARERAKESAREQARQQAAAAELGQSALATRDIPGLLDEATALVTRTLDVKYSMILEQVSEGEELLLRAGRGWEPGLVGRATARPGIASHAGYTLMSQEPVVIRDLKREKRFTPSPMLVEHGVVSGISTLIHGSKRPYGILAAYTTRRREFSKESVDFLSSIANVLAEAIERERNEKQLREQREWLSVTLSSIGDGIIATNELGDITLINSVAQRLTGWTAAQSNGRSLDDVFALVDETGQHVPSPAARVIQDGSAVLLGDQVELINKHGDHVPIDDSAAPIRDEQGKLIGVVLIFRDISDRRSAEQALKESEERYRTIADTASDAIITIDQDGRIQLANRTAEDIFGYTAQELLDHPATFLMHPDDRGRYEQAFLDYKQTVGRRRSWRAAHVRGMHKDGREIPLEISLGDFVREGRHYFTAILRDIGARLEAERRLEFQASILDNVRDSVIVTDVDGRVLYWNEGATSIFGYSAQEMIGKSLAPLYLDGSLPAYASDLKQIGAGQDYAGEWQGRRKDGGTVWVMIKSTVMRDQSGEPTGYIGVATDISKRKQVERRLAAQYSVTRVLAESETIAQATTKILREICESVDWEIGVLWTLDQRTDVMRCLDVWRMPDVDIHDFEMLTREMLFPIGIGLPGRVWASGTPVWVADIATDPAFVRAKVALKNNIHAASAFPIRSGDKFTGVIEFYSLRARAQDDGLVELMSSLGSQIAQFIERKRTEEALRLSEEQHSIILQGVADGITAQDSEGRLIYANQAAARLIGYESPDELLSVPLAQVLARFELFDENEQPLPALRLPSRISLETGKPANELLRFQVLETGHERWSQVNSTPILDEEGRARFVINIFHDVTERRRAEQQVREQSELLRITLESIGDAVVSTNAGDKITFMNPVAEALTGWTLNEAMGRPLEDVLVLVNEETRQAVESPVTRVLREQNVQWLANHTLLIARDGKTIPIDDSGAPIRDEDGKVIGIVLVFRDIAERRRSEQDVSRLAAIVKSSDDAIVSMDLDGTIRSWNPSAERLFYYSAEEVIGQPITIIYPPERLGEFADIIARLRRGESIDHFDTVRLAKTGRRIDVSLGVSLVRNAAGEVMGASKILRDVSDRKRTEQAARFVAETSDVLASSLDYEMTLASVARLAVPQIADWCAIDIQAEDGAIQRLALAHIDPSKIELARELERRFPSDPDAPLGISDIIRSGKPGLYMDIDERELMAAARDPEQLKLLQQLKLKSAMVVPLVARDRTLGAITFASAESNRHFGLSDLELARDLARRVALAVDNARLYRRAQALNEELEQRVVRRTIELQSANQKLESEVAERQRMNNQLRLLSAHLQSAREEERIRIAREIHDEIGQVLTAIKMDLSMLGREIGEDGAQFAASTVQQELGSTTKLVDDAIQTMHHIVRELRPEVLDHLDLLSALEWQAQEFQTRTKIECEFHSAVADLDLDTERSTAVFRILQEALTNVARHADATRVEASVREEEGRLIMEVRDNGRGIAPGEAGNIRTFGILGMRERAHVFGGNVEIVPAPERGTMVIVQIPISSG